MTNIVRSILPLVVTFTLLGGCVGEVPPSRHYILASDPSLAPLEEVQVPAGMSISVGPVRVPSYLDRTQIVTKKSPYQLELAEFDIWAEPLDENITRILVENLSRILGTDQVLAFEERRGAPVDFEVAVDVEKMDAVENGPAELVARWTVLRSQRREHLLTRRSRFQTPLDGGRFEALAAAMSRNVSQLSLEIAAAIGELAQ